MKQTVEAKKEIEISLQTAQWIAAREEEAQALGVMARLHLDAAAYSEAERNIAETIEIVENTRLELRARGTRAGYFSTVRDYYDLAMDIAAAQKSCWSRNEPGPGVSALVRELCWTRCGAPAST